ncbi:MAG: hypothetical protein E7087_00425 [Bacteroidales bacterium]|nr:hypothetical protein [Bacteroidales bacterium]
MNGFIIKAGEENIYAALKSGSFGIIISNKEGDFNISINGMDENALFYSWEHRKLNLNEVITIAFDTLDESVISTPTNIRDVNNTIQEQELELELYYKLKKELLDKGLISE